MATWIIDEREKQCPACGRGPYKALGQHWAKSKSCSPPPLTDEQTHLVRGLLLGDATLEGSSTPLLAVSSTREKHSIWIHRQLGWLSRGVEKTDRGEFRVRTVTHEGLGRYLTWAGQHAVPTTGWTLTPTSARCWYACDGTLTFTSSGATGQVTFPAQTDRLQAALCRLLYRVGFSPLRWGRRIALPREETTEWLEWLGEPTPGSEHKWARTKSEYEAERGDTDETAPGDRDGDPQATVIHDQGSATEIDAVVPHTYRCPDCQREFVRPAQHWAAAGNGCEWPPITEVIAVALDALAVSGASAIVTTETPHISVSTPSQERAAWFASELGWLVGTLTHREKENTVDQYVVRTMSHPGLESYVRWAGNNGVPPERIRWSPRFGRILHSRLGSFASGKGFRYPSLHINARQSERRLNALERIVSQAGVTPSRGTDRLILSQRDTLEYLRRIGPPAPGSAFRWMLSEDLRERAEKRATSSTPLIRLGDSLTSICRRLLSFVVEYRGAISDDEWDRLVASPDADTVAEQLGGGSWDDALSVVNERGVDDLTTWDRHPPNYEFESDHEDWAVNPGVRWTTDDCLEALQQCAETLGKDDFTRREYAAWRADCGDVVPTYWTIVRQLGSFAAAKTAASGSI